MKIHAILILLLLAGCIGSDESLHSAVSRGNIERVRMLVERGADLNAEGMYGRTPLYYAALCGQSNIVDYLLDKGADPTKGASWKGHNTPLHVAAFEGHVSIVAALIEHGVKVDLLDDAQQTPLHEAAWHGQPDVVRYLISQGADVNAKDKSGHTPLVSSGRVSLSTKYTQHDSEIAALLVEAGADVNHVDNFGDTALHCACKQSNTNLVEYLLKQGADPNQSTAKESPLELAVRTRKTEVEKLLRKHGAKQKGIGATPPSQESHP